jgi:hypothetical protein
MTDDEKAFADWTAAGNGVPLQYKGREHVWDRKVDSMKEGGAAFGKFPQMKPKRDKQDPEAAKNVPVDLARGFASGVLGAPGDIESLIRMLPGLDERTFLPTSEDVEKRLPFRSDTPVSKAAAGAGTLAGGFYTGPGSPLRVVGALPGAIKHGAQEFAKASVAGVPHVVKPKGGNWLTGSLEKDLEPLKRRMTRAAEQNFDPAQGMTFGEIRAQDALNNWVDSNLTNYVKKQMGTPEDPVRKLAEEGITHKANLPDHDDYTGASTRHRRKEAGFPEEGMAQSPLAKAWEQASDESIESFNVGDLQSAPEKHARLLELINGFDALKDKINQKFIKLAKSRGMSEDEANIISKGMPFDKKTKMVGDTDYMDANIEYSDLASPLQTRKFNINKENPWVAKVDPKSSVYSSFTDDLGFDHIMDVLREDLAAGRIRPEQLNKVSITDAVRRAHQYDQEAARKMAEAQIKNTEGMPIHKEYPEGYKWVELNMSPEQKAAAKEYQDKFALELGKRVSAHPGDKNGIIPTQAIKKQLQEELGPNPIHKLEEALKYEGDTMGHCVGGYCPDVMEGKSRIFSLRSAKGEPHVTIETRPNQSLDYNSWFSKQPEEVQNKIAQRRVEDKNHNIYEGPEYLAAREALLPRIVQIKGKQNRAPNEEYLPYVQDFVRGGKWSDVGDLGNTGLYSSKDVVNYMPESFTMSRNARTLALGRARRAQDLPDYITKAEYEAMLQKHAPEDIWAAEKAQRAAEDDELLRQLRPPEGMANGGEVHMAGGGAAIKAALAKLGKFATEADLAAIKEAGRVAHEQEAFTRAAKNADVEKRLQSMPPRSKAANMEMGMYHPVGGGLKLTKPFESLHSTRVPNPKVNKPDVKILTPEDLYRERAGLFPLVGDKADTGTFLTHIGEKELEVPVGLGGGPRYMDANYNIVSPSKSAAWESGTARTTSLGNQAQRIAESDRPAFGVYTAGSGTNTDFNIMGANAVLQQLGQSKLTKKAEKAFDKAMREEGTKAFPPIPDWPGIRSPQLEDMLLDKSNGILRTKLFDTMGKENFQSMGFPDVPATRKAIMDPQLYDTPTHEAGFRIARMDPTGRIVEDPLHPSDYPTAMAGELGGQLDMGVDYKDMFSTHFANRRLLSQPESGDYYSFSRAFPIQYADQEWLDKIKKAQEAKDKLIKTGSYAKGGLAAATKSSQLHD